MDNKSVVDVLYGFMGHSIKLRGIISVPITLGKNQRTKTINIKWVVVPGKSTFNAIIGRPTLQALGANTYVEYVKMKFPSDKGVKTRC